MCPQRDDEPRGAFVTFYASFMDLTPGMATSEDCENLFYHLRAKRAISEELGPTLSRYPAGIG